MQTASKQIARRRDLDLCSCWLPRNTRCYTSAGSTAKKPAGTKRTPAGATAF